VAEPWLNGRKLNYPRGKAIGGSSSINAMISMRGQAGDYDHWRQLGLTGWGWDDVRPVFRHLDRHFLGDSEHHRSDGELCVEAPRVRWDILDAIADAAEEMGIPKTPDFNTGDNTGSCYFHVNQKRGRRWSAARGFLKPVLSRSNLRLETDVLVEKVLFDGKHACGVRFQRGNESVEARAKGEVILCAGAIGSVQVLQRSGIGPAAWLGELGIPVVHAMEGVGRNLQDHLQLRAMYRVSGVKTLNEIYYSLWGRPLMGLQYALLRRGPMTMAASQLGIFTKSDAGQERANIQFHIQPLSLDRFGTPLLLRFPAIRSVPAICVPHRAARCGSPRRDRCGQMRLYLSTDEDRRIAADCIRLTAAVVRQPAINTGCTARRKFRPGPAVPDSDAG
jgi:choline dehydrogenase-like flavoprotein